MSAGETNEHHQIRISDTGEQCVQCGQPLEEHWVGSCPDPVQPLTWDGEPLWSPSTVREGLFSTEAFEQMPGQMAMDNDVVLVYTVIGLSGLPLAWSYHEIECRRYNDDYCRGEGIVSGGFVRDPEAAYRGYRIPEL